MFQDASAFNGDLSGWDTAAVSSFKVRPRPCVVPRPCTTGPAYAVPPPPNAHNTRHSPNRSESPLLPAVYGCENTFCDYMFPLTLTPHLPFLRMCRLTPKSRPPPPQDMFLRATSFSTPNKAKLVCAWSMDFAGAGYSTAWASCDASCCPPPPSSYTFNNNEELKTAANAYVSDPTGELATSVGPINQWDTSKVTSMDVRARPCVLAVAPQAQPML
jgi:surface protein